MRALPSILLLILACDAPASWTHHAGAPDRVAITDAPGAPLAPAWIADMTPTGDPVSFVGQSAPVVHGDHVYAHGHVNGTPSLIAVDRAMGSIAWSQAVMAPYLDSWSAPVIDASNGVVISATGDELRAFDLDDGSPRWVTVLPLDIVNASALVTDDQGDADRLFITDYDGFMLFGGGRLHCVNVDPFDAASNPHQPGEIVWSASLNHATSGNSPAYHSGVVYVADAGDFNFGVGGSIRAYDASASSAPAPLWTFTDPSGDGFYGGVSVDVATGALYAATYDFFGMLDSANLVSLDAATGALRWSVACNRTNSIPVPLGDGRILLSGGVSGFGSAPALELFIDNGTSATRLWNTALATWTDANSNSLLDVGEFTPFGGAAHQPVVTTDGGNLHAWAGAAPVTGGGGGSFDAYANLRRIDLKEAPNAPGFIVEHFAAAGASPAVCDGTIYAIGKNGLYAFGLPAAFDADVNGDGLVDPRDLHAWFTLPTDINADGAIDAADRSDLRDAIRDGEPADIAGRAPA